MAAQAVAQHQLELRQRQRRRAARSSVQRSSALRTTNSCCCEEPVARPRRRRCRRCRPSPARPHASGRAVAPHLEPGAVDQQLLEAQLQRQQRLHAPARRAPAPGAAPRGPARSSRRTSRSSKAGTQPLDAPGCGRSSPAAPMASLAELFDAARHSSMCGRITQCSVSHAAQEHAPQQQQHRPRPRWPAVRNHASGAARRQQIRGTRVRPFGVRACCGATARCREAWVCGRRSAAQRGRPRAARANLAQPPRRRSMGSALTATIAPLRRAGLRPQPLRAARPPPLCGRAAAAAAGRARRAPASPRWCSTLQDGGRALPSALRVARQLVLERLAVLDVEQAAPLDHSHPRR